ncbi:histidine protein methyltransferase 1 [Aspergillus terreus]|uniref:protein-histidine N-methyltransferase n=1 Tax=Aspergillus terreus TaxID=33178 RepID=A0A5M3YL23_ASPTE|nr:hypothetical protein ATETN484_0001018700 [Aspergillus terreus]GFF13997.1 histidine protein methyltransferase 1 [Aspergillus terreus]
MAFSFGFSGDDIDIDDSELHEEGVNLAQTEDNGLPALVPAQRHDIKEWIPTFPSQISYNKLAIEVPKNGTDEPLTLARREVFDIRTQLMAEDTADHENEELISGLEEGDIKPNFYEGGFKTWECALDLAKLVAAEGVASDSAQDMHIIELGAGTAVPSLALFAQLLARPEPSGRKTHFTFADYNSAVLRLVTLPNLLLTWNYIVSQRTSVSAGAPAETEQEEEELDVTPELLERFEKDLAEKGITVEFISGAWSPAFVELVFAGVGSGHRDTLVMASETIYSPASLSAFSETLLALLRRSTEGGGRSRTLVAAKKVYFGVGGGVDEFLAVFRGLTGDAVRVQERLDVKSEGVGRVVLEIAG